MWIEDQSALKGVKDYYDRYTRAMHLIRPILQHVRSNRRQTEKKAAILSKNFPEILMD
jgi:hypothetical protein